MIVRSALRWLLLLILLYLGSGYADAGPGGDFTLTDHNGQKFHLADHRGKVILLFFGYTYCPDICPTELASISHILGKLGPREHLVQSVFITVDPLRDTAEKLRKYLGYFSPRLIGLTGSQQEIERVKSAYQVRSSSNKKHPGDIHYSVDHTANLYVIDQNGKLVNIVPYGFPGEHVLMLIDQLLTST